MAYLNDVSTPISVKVSIASSVNSTSSSSHLIYKICAISFSLYGLVVIIRRRSSKSKGIPWGLLCLVPLIVVIPRFVAKITTGAVSDSRALLRKEKHSRSNICASSIKSTPGTISAFPSSLHSETFVLIYSLTSYLISPVSPENKI